MALPCSAAADIQKLANMITEFEGALVLLGANTEMASAHVAPLYGAACGRVSASACAAGRRLRSILDDDTSGAAERATAQVMLAQINAAVPGMLREVEEQFNNADPTTFTGRWQLAAPFLGVVGKRAMEELAQVTAVFHVGATDVQDDVVDLTSAVFELEEITDHFPHGPLLARAKEKVRDWAVAAGRDPDVEEETFLRVFQDRLIEKASARLTQLRALHKRATAQMSGVGGLVARLDELLGALSADAPEEPSTLDKQQAVREYLVQLRDERPGVVPTDWLTHPEQLVLTTAEGPLNFMDTVHKEALKPYEVRALIENGHVSMPK